MIEKFCEKCGGVDLYVHPVIIESARRWCVTLPCGGIESGMMRAHLFPTSGLNGTRPTQIILDDRV